MATPPCSICKEPMVQKTIAPYPATTGAKPVSLAVCRRCDVRQCRSCGHYIQHPLMKFCRCGRDLFQVAA